MKIVIASNNQGKIKEINNHFNNDNYEFLSQADFHVPEAIENGKTFIENAIIKARNACFHTQLAAIADDSGLVVNARNGAPGLISSRYAGPQANSQNNINKLLSEMQWEENRAAHFICTLVFLRHVDDPDPIIAQGYWHGEIALQEKGESGFGYDPIFFIPHLNKTAAELSLEEKNTMSHRAQALTLLKKLLKA